MCQHSMKQINDIKVCIRCGLTFPPEGRPFFDKGIVSYYSKKGGKKRERNE